MDKNIIFIFLVFLYCCNSHDNFIEIRNETGQVTEKYQISRDSLKDGIYQAFYSNGQLLESAYYKNGILDGKRILYYADDQVEIEEIYVEGLLHGPYVRYYTNGNPTFIAEYVKNVLQGEAKSYYKSGQLKEIVVFEENEENGPFTEFFENGKVKWRGHYINGDNEVGELEQYDETGKLIRKLWCDSLSICHTTWLHDSLKPNEN